MTPTDSSTPPPSLPPAPAPGGPQGGVLDVHKDIERVKSMRAYIDAKVRRQSYVFGAAAVSLILIWINMVPLHQAAREAASTARVYLRSFRKYEEYRKTFSSLRETRKKAGTAVQDLNAERRRLKGKGADLSPTETEQLHALGERLKTLLPIASKHTVPYSLAIKARMLLSSHAGKDYDRLLAALDSIKVPFKISDFELPLSYRYAALAWQWLSVVVASYLLYSRRKALAFHTQILRQLKLGVGASSTPADDPPAEAPFWLAPLPSRDSMQVTRDELQRWLRVGKPQTCAMAVCWAVALGFSYYAASTQAAVIIMRSAHGGYEPLLSLLWAGAVGAMVCVAVLWFWPFRIEEWADAPRPLEPVSRRQALRLILAAGIAIPGAMVVLGSMILPWRASQPRFRRLRKSRTRATWPSGFYLNPKSRVLHYLHTGGQIRGLTNHGKAHLVPYSFEGKATMEREPHVNVATFSYAYEQEVRRNLASRNRPAAIELLFRAVTQDVDVGKRTGKRSLRLYDLLAGLIVNSGSADEMERFRKLVANERAGPAFGRRLAKWADPASTWYQRWRDKSKV